MMFEINEFQIEGQDSNILGALPISLDRRDSLFIFGN